MKTLKMWRAVVALMAFAMVAAACGGGESADDASTTAATEATTATTAATTTTEAETLAVSSLEDVESAVIQIVAEGTFVDPEVGTQFNTAGSGSGFIIDESGIAVTNNHVVTGAAFLQVFVGGSSEPQNARVLGVSECSDLAVIDIDGDGYAYLEWYQEALNVGTDVFAAGFPLGDPEFTLTRGIISKESAGGETTWASVDSVLEHDATINPGNSGGPLVTEDGQVVGVNYAGASSTNQYFAISREEALPIIEQLRSEESVTSIGINGEVVFSEADGISGVWVSSVESGSPADAVGIVGGDIVTRLEGLVLGTDGTMSDYCDILRSRKSDDVLAIEVLRYNTGEILEGRLNDSPLETSFSFLQEVADDVVDEGSADISAAGEYTEYVRVTDDSGVIEVAVPAEWADLDGTAIDNVGPSITAATSVEGFYTTWTTPGVEVTASKEFGPDDIDFVLESLSESDDCTETFPAEPYEDPLYTGKYQVYDKCGGTDSAILTVVAAPEDGGFLVIVFMQVVSEADLAAANRILETFAVIADF